MTAVRRRIALLVGVVVLSLFLSGCAARSDFHSADFIGAWIHPEDPSQSIEFLPGGRFIMRNVSPGALRTKDKLRGSDYHVPGTYGLDRYDWGGQYLWLEVDLDRESRLPITTVLFTLDILGSGKDVVLVQFIGDPDSNDRFEFRRESSASPGGNT